MHRLLLASASPRRLELLVRAGFNVTVVPVKVSEIPQENLTVPERILDIARVKLTAALALLNADQGPGQVPLSGPFLVLTADTEVVLEDQTLGKPVSADHARDMLRRLSGRAHRVMTAVWIHDSLTGRQFSHLETTTVTFRHLSEEAINSYVASGECMDKAGSYAIQGRGRQLIESIEGDFDNVVGLPVTAVTALFARQGWRLA